MPQARQASSAYSMLILLSTETSSHGTTRGSHIPEPGPSCLSAMFCTLTQRHRHGLGESDTRGTYHRRTSTICTASLLGDPQACAPGCAVMYSILLMGWMSGTKDGVVKTWTSCCVCTSRRHSTSSTTR